MYDELRLVSFFLCYTIKRNLGIVAEQAIKLKADNEGHQYLLLDFLSFPILRIAGKLLKQLL